MGKLALDDIDREILRALQENGRNTVKEIASRVKLSVTPVFERIKNLERAGYIKKYVAILDAEKLDRGFSVFCNIRLNKVSSDVAAEFVERINDIPEVSECYSVTGQYHFMLRVRVPDMQYYRDFVMNVLGKIDTVASVDSSFVMNEDKCTHAIVV